MNKLKKIVFSILLLVGNYVCSAQEISIRGGLNLSKAPIDLGETPTHGDSKFFPGLHVGPTIDFGINSLLSFETGLLYSTKGNKELHNRTVDTISSLTMSITYLDIPFNLKINYPFKNVILFANGGGYMAYGMFGHFLSLVDVDGIHGYWQKIVWGDQEGSFRRLDYGVNIGLGVKYKAMQFGICYENGIANIAGYNRSETKAHNRVTELFLSYVLWNKSKTKH
jgi:hypothetical protein